MVDNVKSQCLNCGGDIWDKPKKNRKYCSCSCRMIHLLPNQKYKRTGIELKIKSFLTIKQIPFKFQPYIKGIVNADFLIYPNILIFADGDYWHSLPQAIQRDSIVNEKLSKTEYSVLRFKGTEINKSFDSVQNKIMETIDARAK
jgi:very-short-patch-repair endonuclease